ncbi:hypothetical protein ACIBK9_11655 [Nonomuraea sp. NPDC050227]|uniref:hypothetical protein n=1 Tax=Nonomuraea sp. NPDC050227 TaxID=3364360 RepID=UPI00378C6CE7
MHPIGMCGEVWNHTNWLIRITDNWGGVNDSRTWHWLNPGQSGHDENGIGLKDVDGFYIPTNCKYTTLDTPYGILIQGPGWIKIHDWQWVDITRMEC